MSLPSATTPQRPFKEAHGSDNGRFRVITAEKLKDRFLLLRPLGLNQPAHSRQSVYRNKNWQRIRSRTNMYETVTLDGAAAAHKYVMALDPEITHDRIQVFYNGHVKSYQDFCKDFPEVSKEIFLSQQRPLFLHNNVKDP